MAALKRVTVNGKGTVRVRWWVQPGYGEGMGEGLVRAR